ncbi:hypothetical protein [Streptomyces sp. NPDC005732]|uniref:hypothetical protein n=1 Tax=Streptomyces sp. NPDC005732 TaxID=3157057 RepID=UPI0033E84C03
MATIGYAGLPIPGGGDGPTVPGHLAELATAIDPHLVQHVTDLAARNATLSAAPVHTLAIAADGTTWVKVSTGNVWVTIWEPIQDWQPITLASGFEAGQTNPECRIDRGQVYMRGRIQRTDSQPILTAGGAKLGTVPDDFIPEQIASFAGGASTTGDAINGVCRVETFSPDQDANSLGGRGSIIAYSQDGTQDAGTPGLMWVDISGSYWLD